MTNFQQVTAFQKAYKYLLRNGLIERQRDIVEKTGIDKGQLSTYVNTNKKPSTMFINKFEDAFGIKMADFENDLLTDNTSSLHEPQVSYLDKRRNQKVENAGMPVFESSPATLSNIQSYRDEKQTEPDFWLSIPQYRHCNYACRAKGDSMHPVVRNHALVGGREITELSVIIFGDIYIVHTRNGIETIKYIHPDPDNQDKILLVPYNGQAKTTPIHKSEILRLYVAEFVINPL